MESDCYSGDEGCMVVVVVTGSPYDQLLSTRKSFEHKPVCNSLSLSFPLLLSLSHIFLLISYAIIFNDLSHFRNIKDQNITLIKLYFN
jgi:hypothetical protein